MVFGLGSLHFDRAKVDDGEAEQDQGQRLMGQRRPIGTSEQRRDAEPDLSGRRRQDDGAARAASPARRERGDGLHEREGDDGISDHTVIELRRRRVVEHRLQRAGGERLARNEGPSISGQVL